MSEALSTEEAVKQLISGLRDLATSRTVSDLGAAFPQQVEVIWRKPKSLVSYAFLFNRYAVPVFMALDIYQIIGTARNVPDRFCHEWLYVESVLQIVCHGIAHWLAALRVRALHSSKRWIDLVLYVSGAFYIVTAFVVLFLVLVDIDKTYAWSTTLNMCFGDFPSWMYWCWVPGLLFEVVLFSLIIVKAVRDWRRDIDFPITRLLYRDGFLYFIVIAACSIFNIIAWAALPTSMVALAKYFAFALVAVMSSRIVLNLRTLRQTPVETEHVSTGVAFELGALSSMRRSRRSAYPTSSFPLPLSGSKGGGGDSGRLQTTSVPATIQIDVYREIEVDEVEENDSDDPRWRSSKKQVVGF
ncbi:hypothetical protein FRC04_005294 [Tulasnella sp. 424]|nr:hypothetical protein FRC04_005294 [Tulasnella sp. 424]